MLWPHMEFALSSQDRHNCPFAPEVPAFDGTQHLLHLRSSCHSPSRALNAPKDAEMSKHVKWHVLPLPPASSHATSPCPGLQVGELKPAEWGRSDRRRAATDLLDKVRSQDVSGPAGDTPLMLSNVLSHVRNARMHQSRTTANRAPL